MAKLLLCLMVFSLSFGTFTAIDEPKQERRSLVHFKNSLQNPQVLSGWNKTTRHCHWFGVKCRHSRVVSLVIQTQSLKGPVSPFLFNLSSLRILDLSKNLLFGQLSPQVSNLKRLKMLSVGENQLSGSIPSQLGLLTRLETISLRSNSFTGEMPSELGDIKQLKSLDFSGNGLNGTIPSRLGDLTQLQDLDLSDNLLSGSLPVSLLKNLQSLSYLDVSNNLLSGNIPPEIGNLKKLTELGNCRNLKAVVLSFNALSGSLPEQLAELQVFTFSAGMNQLSGPLPSWLGKWNQMDSLWLYNNQFVGRITPEIGNCSMLKYISLSNNKLSGPIPRELCNSGSLVEINLDGNMLSGTIEDVFDRCTNLSELVLVNNRISGSIPEYISELPLKVFDLQYNNFTGVIPVSLWNSENLMEFNAASNLLEGSLSWEISNAVALEKLDLSSNMLTRQIPKKIGNLTNIQILKLNSNFFDGIIPMEFGDCISLNTLDLGSNNLNGSIPEKIADLNHGKFDLSYNTLSGPIPEVLGSCVVVVYLLLNNNMLSGKIPGSLSRLTNLTTLNLFGNLLTGSIPPEFGDSLKVQGLYLGHNQLTGSIPESLGYLSGLVNGKAEFILIMNLSNNFFDGGLPQSLNNLPCLTSVDFHLNKFTGEIPPELGNLVQLEYLDFSMNMLDGHIPEKLCSLPYLLYLNLADNRLEGEVPRSGICQNLSIISLTGNKDLCEKIMGSDCQILTFGKLALVGIVVGSVLVIAIIVFVLRSWIQRSNRQSDPKETEESKQNSISEQNRKSISDRSSIALMEHLSINLAMFEPSLGGKCTMPDQKTVAVKKLSQATGQCDREFAAEMETLDMVKHQNLVQLLGYCSVGEEKLLVYEYMVNGSLDDWLRNRAASLDWGKRCKIAYGAARGISFLHHGFKPYIIHMDIKTSNILLNDYFEAKVSDFGLARLISDCESHVSTDTADTIGYVPSEYGQAGRANERGDIYSFGVILLELVTGKQPTGPEFEDKDGGNLVDWVLLMMKKE
ncbi:Leucine-rich repeat receptor protein kinase EMS1 [Citrus sinensis]|nr:Leucine-rich repeat receptor protein kinase EMS1 [Citrus sinensis]